MHRTHTNTTVSLLLGETPQAQRAPATKTQVSWPTYLSLLQPLCWCKPPQLKVLLWLSNLQKCLWYQFRHHETADAVDLLSFWVEPHLSVLPPLGLSWLYLTAVARALLAVNYKTTSVRLRRQQVHSTVAEGLPGRKNWASDFLLIICSLVIGRLSLCWYGPPFCQRSRVLITMPSRQVKHFYLDNWQSGKKTQDQVCDIIWQQHISINYSHFEECYQHLRFVSFGSSLLQLRTSPVKAKLLLDTE